jgi:hypothetical protein
MFGALNFTFNRRNICLAISATALKKLFMFTVATLKKKVVLDCFCIHFYRPRKTFLNFLFYSVQKGFCSVKKKKKLYRLAYSA